MATFYGGNLAGPTEMGDMFTAAANSNRAETEAAVAKRAFEKSKKIDELFSKHTDEAGNLSPAFYKDATAAGLGRAEIEQAADYAAKQRDVGVKNAEAENAMRAMGYDPNAIGRNNVQFGEPTPTRIASPSMGGAVAPLDGPTIDADKLRSPSEVGQASGVPQTATTGRTGGKSGAEDFLDKAHSTGWKSWGDQESAAPNEVIVTAQGPVSKGEEGRLPPDTVGPDVFAPTQDARSWDQRLSDSFNPSAVIGASQMVGAQQGPDESLFAWSPENDESMFRKYGTALKAKMQASGITSAPDYLRQVYAATIRQNTPAAPNEMLLSQGPKGRAEYRQQVNEYLAAKEKAQGLAEQKVMEARSKLTEDAESYGKLSQEDEKFNAEMGGRRKGGGAGDIMRTRAVSLEEKTAGEIIANSYQDLKAAERRGGFEGDYAAAMARAKADGNVNEDAIVGHLVAMGSWPSARAVALKNILRESSGSAPGDIYKMLKRKVGDFYGADDAKRDSWFNDSKNNMRQAMQLKGYDIKGGPPTVTSQAQLNALKPGAEYMDAKGRLHKKGGR